jgi:acyl carrier protein
MGVKLEKLVQGYYDALEEGKILGRKCPKCGAVEWPPVYACNACGSTETEWYEMTGKGTIQMLIMPTVMSLKPALKDLEPYAYGAVKTEEGPERNIMVRGVTKQNETYIREHMPYPVHMEIVQRDGYKTAVFTIDEPKSNGMAESDDSSGVAGSGTLKRLTELVAKIYRKNPSELKPQMTFERDLKAPSILFVGLVAQLEDEFDAIISITEAGAAKTIGGLAELIDKQKGL